MTVGSNYECSVSDSIMECKAVKESQQISDSIVCYCWKLNRKYFKNDFNKISTVSQELKLVGKLFSLSFSCIVR